MINGVGRRSNHFGNHIAERNIPASPAQAQSQASTSRNRQHCLESQLPSNHPPREHFRLAIVQYYKIFHHSPVTLTVLFFRAVVYSYYYILLITITEVFQSTYGFSTGIASLVNLGITIGVLLGGPLLYLTRSYFHKYYFSNRGVRPNMLLHPISPSVFILSTGCK